MITLSNGHCFEYMTASGALGFDGKGWPWEKPLKWFGLLMPSLFTNVIKTLTPEPKEGNLRMYNPLGCIRPIFRGLKVVGIVNAVGLTNPGIDWWAKNIGPNVKKTDKLVASIFGDNEELEKMARIMNGFELVGLEINSSCPNTKEDLARNADKTIGACQSLKNISKHPLILKLSVAQDALKIAKNIKGVIEAISINSVPWNIVFPNRKSPLAHLGGGGVSGKIVQPFVWELIDKLRGVAPEIPTIASSVWDFDDIRKLKETYITGAISFGSVFIPYPCRPTLFARKDKKQRIVRLPLK